MLDGNPIVLNLPSLSDTMAVAVAKTATALSTLATGLTPKVTPAQFSVNSALTMAGNALTNVGSAQFVDGNQPSAAGSMYYHSGEFYLVDAAGPIQVTALGVLNVAGQVGIVGDYGGSNPARVTYVDSSGQYQFTQDTSIWADVVCGNVILEGTNGNVKIGVDTALTGGATINVKSLPAAGTSLLCYKASSSTLEDSAVNSDAKNLAGDLTMPSGNLTLTSGQLHLGTGLVTVGGTMMASFTPNGLITVGCSPSNLQILASATTWSYDLPPVPLRVGDKITSYLLTCNISGGGTYTVALRKAASPGAIITIDTHNFNTGSNSITVTSPVAISPGERWFFTVSTSAAGGAIGDAITGLNFTFGHP